MFSVFFHRLMAAFVDPLRSKGRAKTLVGGLCGGVGLGLLDFPVVFAMAGHGLTATLIFLFVRLGMSGLLCFDLFYRLMSCRHGKTFSFLIQIAGIGLFLGWPDAIWANIFGYNMIAIPFWAAFHLRFAMQRSIQNLGGESAFSTFVFLLSGSLGTFIGGFLEQGGHWIYAVGFGGALITASTVGMLARVARTAYVGGSLKLLRKRGPSTRISVFVGILDAVQSFGMPAWLRVMGLSALVASALLALRPILGFLIMPLVGWLVRKGSLGAVRIGGGLVSVGWLLLSVLVYGWGKEAGLFFLVPFALLAAGSNLIGSAEVSRWYKLSSSVGVVAREQALAIGRCPTFLVSVPLMFLAPIFFPLLGVLSGCLFVFGTAFKLKKKAALWRWR